jgi:hypothetical protein
MSTSDPLDARVLQHKTLLLLVIAVSAAFAWILCRFTALSCGQPFLQ